MRRKRSFAEIARGPISDLDKGKSPKKWYRYCTQCRRLHRVGSSVYDQHMNYLSGNRVNKAGGKWPYVK